MAPGNDLITIVLVSSVLLSTGYAAGRLHQWYRHALERHDAWRDGYDQASGTMFKHAARAVRRRVGERTGEIPRVVEQATITPITDAPSAGRHSLDLRHETTRRLPGSDQKAI